MVTRASRPTADGQVRSQDPCYRRCPCYLGRGKEVFANPSRGPGQACRRAASLRRGLSPPRYISLVVRRSVAGRRPRRTFQAMLQHRAQFSLEIRKENRKCEERTKRQADQAKCQPVERKDSAYRGLPRDDQKTNKRRQQAEPEHQRGLEHRSVPFGGSRLCHCVSASALKTRSCSRPSVPEPSGDKSPTRGPGAGRRASTGRAPSKLRSNRRPSRQKPPRQDRSRRSGRSKPAQGSPGATRRKRPPPAKPLPGRPGHRREASAALRARSPLGRAMQFRENEGTARKRGARKVPRPPRSGAPGPPPSRLEGAWRPGTPPPTCRAESSA